MFIGGGAGVDGISRRAAGALGMSVCRQLSAEDASRPWSEQGIGRDVVDDAITVESHGVVTRSMSADSELRSAIWLRPWPWFGSLGVLGWASRASDAGVRPEAEPCVRRLCPRGVQHAWPPWTAHRDAAESEGSVMPPLGRERAAALPAKAAAARSFRVRCIGLYWPEPCSSDRQNDWRRHRDNT
jgi:hypothetical protein